MLGCLVVEEDDAPIAIDRVEALADAVQHRRQARLGTKRGQFIGDVGFAVRTGQNAPRALLRKLTTKRTWGKSTGDRLQNWPFRLDTSRMCVTGSDADSQERMRKHQQQRIIHPERDRRSFSQRLKTTSRAGLKGGTLIEVYDGSEEEARKRPVGSHWHYWKLCMTCKRAVCRRRCALGTQIKREAAAVGYADATHPTMQNSSLAPALPVHAAKGSPMANQPGVPKRELNRRQIYDESMTCTGRWITRRPRLWRTTCSGRSSGRAACRASRILP